MDIEDLLADLENNNSTVNGRTTINNTALSVNSSKADLTEDVTRGLSTGLSTHIASESDLPFSGQNISHMSAFDGETGQQMTKKEKNQSDIYAFSQLTTAWRNERMSPELLPFNEKYFNIVSENMKQQIEYMDYWNMVQESESEIGAGDHRNHEQLLLEKRITKLPIYCMEAELERVKFLLRSYLRCRLQKIDTFLLLLHENDQLAIDEVTGEEKSILIINKLLSEPEYRYFIQKVKITIRLYSSTVLLNLPENFQQMNDENSNMKMIQEPDLERFVFIFVKGSLESDSFKEQYRVFNRETQEEVELVVGGIYVMRYDLIENLLKEGLVMLI